LAKTNAQRILDQLGIHYETRVYEVEESDLSAETVAVKIGMPAEQVFKTLLAIGDRNGPCLAVIPGNMQLDLKALARATGDRKIETAPLKDVLPMTGYMRGAVTAFGCRKPYPVWLDETAILWDVISVSAGVRGTQLLIAPDGYVRATGAQMAEIAK
jgi:Cys-tRNA(Pro)/Cys-tRNA(Cys) deacylase